MDRRPARSIATARWIICCLAALCPAAAAADVTNTNSFLFGRVLSGQVLTHEFTVRNAGSAPLRVARVQLTSPLIVTSMPPVVAAGAEGRIAVRMDTSGLRGRFVGEVDVIWADDANEPVSFSVEGEIVAPVEISPAPVFFLAARRGETRHTSMDIINHETEPLRIDEVSHSQDRLTTRLDVLEEGRRYRLLVSLKPDGPGGKQSESIVLHTTSARQPTISIVANTLLRERVYTFPDEVDFGTLSLSRLEHDPGLLTTMAQTLMVYQFGGTNFDVQVRPTLPQVVVVSERGPHGDRYQNTVSLTRDQLHTGPLRGSILIHTNDAQFPELVVPVVGTIVP
jgi:hypothetical protein